MNSRQHRDNISTGKTAFYGTGSMFLMVAIGAMVAWLSLNFFRIDIPTAHMAVLIKKTGIDLNNDQEIAPDATYKGVQKDILMEGKHWRNPYFWDWEIYPQLEVPHGKMGVLVSLTGDDLGYGEFLAHIDPEKDPLQGGVKTKGIVPNVLREGRYPINKYLFELEIHDPKIVAGGYRGVITNLAGPLPENANTLLVEPGFRGVQQKSLEAGTYYLNPYEYSIKFVDCRSQRFNLAENKDMGFPSKDGFWVSLDGIIEFHVNPEKAAEVFVTYNDEQNGDRIDEEIIRKVIMPIARSYCRVEGSKNAGRDFITGDTRIAFEENFEKVIRDQCQPLGIEILQALITNIRPPQQIAEPVRERELAKQQQTQYVQQMLQQKSEQELAVEKELIKRKKEMVKAEQEVNKLTTDAMREQEVAIIKANEKLSVAKSMLQAAEHEASAIQARGQAEADVVSFQNQAEAAGWKRAITAFQGDGQQLARFVLNQKLAPAYREIMANTENSPIMKIFESFSVPDTAVPNNTTVQPVPASASTTPDTAIINP